MAENTKENLLKAPFIYYISNPKVPELYCLAVPMYVDLSEHIKNYELPNWHTKAPSKDLTNPVWSLDVADWVEADENSQGAILAEAQAKIVELDKAKEQLEQINSANAQQTQIITKQLGNQAEQNKNIMTMMVQMQQTLAILAKNSQSTSQNGAQTTPVQPTTNPTVNTDTNGGNN